MQSIIVRDNASWQGQQPSINLEDTTGSYYSCSLEPDDQVLHDESQWSQYDINFDGYYIEPDFKVEPIWRREHDLGGGYKHNEECCTEMRETPRAQENTNGLGKRTSTVAFAEEQVDIEGIKRKSMKMKAGVAEKQRQFACPFHKRDPVKYRDCFKLTLNRIKDVKQHLRRRHMQHQCYCPCCYDTFDDTRKRDEHTRSNTCTTLDEMPAFEGISDEQNKELNKCADRGLTVELQWFNIWEIIFPDHPPPLSPFLGSYLNEMAPMLRDLWKIEGIGILEGVLRQKAAEVNKNLVHEIVEAVFNRLEEGAGRSQLLTNKAS